MRQSPSKVDPRVRAACEEALVLSGPHDTHGISVSSLAENVTRALRTAKEGMSDSHDVYRTVRRELVLAVMGTRGSGGLASPVRRRLVDDLETALLKSLAPEDPPTTPLLSSDRIQLSPAETYVKALEEAMFRGLGPQAVPRLDYAPLSGEVHFGLEDSPGLERLERLERYAWTGVVDDSKPSLAVSGTHEKGPAVTENKRTEA